MLKRFDMSAPCNQCDGWCERHALWKSAQARKLCEVDEGQRASWDLTTNERQSGLVGTRLAQTLESIGITKDKYVAVKLQFGMPPSCNCNERKNWLNKVSAAFLRS